MTAAWRDERLWRGLADDQAGVVARAQLLQLGWAEGDVDAAVRFAGWQRWARGVYITHRGPVLLEARHWAAVLACGPGAALVSWSALAAWGMTDAQREGAIHVGVEHARRVLAPPGVLLHRSNRHAARTHPAASPPRARPEPALLDATGTCDDGRQVVALLLSATSARRTTADRIEAELEARRSHRWGPLLREVLTDARAGVASSLEHRYLRFVHRAHGLPACRVNAAETQAGVRVYRDVRYPGGLVVELDGAAFHGPGAAVADRRRDNHLVLLGELTLRFGWPEVVGTPCEVAAMVWAALDRVARVGPGPRACSPGCPAPGLAMTLVVAS